MYFPPQMIMSMGFQNNTDTESRFFPLGVYSNKAVLFINRVLNWKKNCCDIISRTAWRSNPEVKGGGLFIQAGGQLAINELGEVFMYFNNPYSIYRNCRVATDNGNTTNTNADLIQDIKDKLANLLKAFWKDSTYADVKKVVEKVGNIYGQRYDHTYLDISKYVEEGADGTVLVITNNDYRCLYEYLKGRDVEKIKAKYGEKVYDDMVGHKVEDQILIAAIDTMKNEIKRLNDELKEKRHNISEVLEVNIKALRMKAEQDDDEIKQTYNTKICEINQQMKEMIKTMGCLTY